jgi:hypothetical protein
MQDLLNNLPQLFGPEDLQKGECKKNGRSAQIVNDVHCPFAEKMKKRKKKAGPYCRFHITDILTFFFAFSRLPQIAGTGLRGCNQAGCLLCEKS